MNENDIADLRRDARKIFYAAVHAAEPAPLVHAALLNAPELRTQAPIRVIAVGKAAPGMAMAALETLGSRVASCLVVAPASSIDAIGDALERDDVQIMRAAHPMPDASSVKAGKAVLEAIHGAASDDVIVALLSGGASSLICQPSDGIAIEDYRQLVQLLMNAGASITELNCVRKHIDDVKGGRLASAAAPRAVVALLISDVVGNSADVIASGPFAEDSTTASDALRVLERYQLTSHTSESILTRLREGAQAAQTIRHGASHVRTQIIADNAHALDAAAAYARRLGYDVARIADPVTGSAHVAGRALSAQMRSSASGADRSCIVAGGETTVAVRGAGRGGRNQELALAAAIELDGATNVVFLSGGTDGIDGVTDAAGAIIDGGTCERMRAAGVDPMTSLEQNDSYTALDASNDLLVTGATGTNVMDVHILLRSGSLDG